MSAPEDNVQAIREALDNPMDAPRLADPGDPAGELRGGRFGERPPFPPGCPITPLGINSTIDGNQTCFYLNFNGQLTPLEANNKHGKLGLVALFGPASDWLEVHFPQWSKPIYEGRGAERRLVREAEIVGFDQAEAARAMVEECVRRGIFDPKDKMRGVGAHRQRGGGLVLHCGDKLYYSRHHATTGEIKDWHWCDPGVLDGYVYTANAPTHRPWHELVHGSVALDLLTTLRTWNWKRPQLDPLFMLGGIGCSMLGGALPWRSNIWITGGAGTGKSTLNGEGGLLDELFGTMQFRTSNTSAAAVRSTLQNSTVTVFFDEIEAGVNNTQATQVVESARVAASGGKMHRSGTDQKTKEFTLRSAFWFSSINIPPLQPQDRSRLAILELQPLRKDVKRLDLESMKLPIMGRKLLRRMVDGWERLPATKAAYHNALAAMGHVQRACDQFGTLLACADLLLFDTMPDDERIDGYVSQCRPDMLAELADEVPDHVEAMQRLLTSEVQARGGDEREALVSWIAGAMNYEIAPLLEGGGNAPGGQYAKRLEQLGLKLVNPVYHPMTINPHTGQETPARWGSQQLDIAMPAYLAVSVNHQGLAKLFAGTPWQGGAWSRSLGRYPGAIERVKVSFARVKANAVLVSLWQLMDETELPEVSKKAGAEEWVRRTVEGVQN
jgi:hypothetical protein